MGALPMGQPHSPGKLATKHVVVQHQHTGLVRPGLVEQRFHSPSFPSRKVPLHSEVSQSEREGAPCDAVRRLRAGNDGFG